MHLPNFSATDFAECRPRKAAELSSILSTPRSTEFGRLRVESAVFRSAPGCVAGEGLAGGAVFGSFLRSTIAHHFAV